MARRIAVVLKGYPRLSETFVAQEILGLQERGIDLLLVSLRQPTEEAVHELHRRIQAPVLYLPEYAKDDPARIARALMRCFGRRGFLPALGTWLRDFWRQPDASRGRRFAQALVLAAELPADVELIYVHFIHTPGSVGRYAARMVGVPFALSAHAKDIWTTPDWEKREKLGDAAWTVTCTEANLRHLRYLAPEADIELVRHGLDLERFPQPCSPPIDPPVILTVARAVEKKGIGTLLEALALLPPSLEWRFEHVGGGALVPELKRRAEWLGLSGRIAWLGSQTDTGVLQAYRRATIFCLPSRIASDGDRDGLPNVLMEAMSQGLPVLASDVSGIPELVRHEVNGLLVQPDDPAALSAAMLRLIGDVELRRRLGAAGRRSVEADFTSGGGIDRIAARLISASTPVHITTCTSPSTLP